MNKITKLGLLSLIAITQTLTLIGGFIAYEQMSEAMARLRWDYKVLLEETHGGLIVDYMIDPNPFAPLIPLVLLGLFLTLVLIADQLSHRKAENKDI